MLFGALSFFALRSYRLSRFFMRGFCRQFKIISILLFTSTGSPRSNSNYQVFIAISELYPYSDLYSSPLIIYNCELDVRFMQLGMSYRGIEI